MSMPRRLIVYGTRIRPRRVFHKLPIVLKSVLVMILSDNLLPPRLLLPHVHLAVMDILSYLRLYDSLTSRE
jgi:hypothetical protein